MFWKRPHPIIGGGRGPIPLPIGREGDHPIPRGRGSGDHCPSVINIHYAYFQLVCGLSNHLYELLLVLVRITQR